MTRTLFMILAAQAVLLMLCVALGACKAPEPEQGTPQVRVTSCDLLRLQFDKAMRMDRSTWFRAREADRQARAAIDMASLLGCDLQGMQ
jgi:hypothetical protein